MAKKKKGTNRDIWLLHVPLTNQEIGVYSSEEKARSAAVTAESQFRVKVAVVKSTEFDYYGHSLDD